MNNYEDVINYLNERNKIDYKGYNSSEEVFCDFLNCPNTSKYSIYNALKDKKGDFLKKPASVSMSPIDYIISSGFDNFKQNDENINNLDFDAIISEYKKDYKKYPKHILELGFDDGIVSWNFLNSLEKVKDCKMISFDLHQHEYTFYAKHLIDKNFPKRHILISGSLKENLKTFDNNFDYKFDIIFVNSSYTINKNYGDILDIKKFSHNDTIVIMNDIDNLTKFNNEIEYNIYNINDKSLKDFLKLVKEKYSKGTLFVDENDRVLTKPTLNDNSTIKYIEKYGFPFTSLEGGSSDENLKLFSIIFENFFKENGRYPEKVAEIGFNSGVSANFFLKMMQEKVSEEKQLFVSFDLHKHDYCIYCKYYIDNLYPNKHLLISGSSDDSIPTFSEFFEKFKFDIIFIDGDHTYSGAYKDISNCKKISKNNTIVILDNMVPHRGVGRGVYFATRRLVEENYILHIDHYEINKIPKSISEEIGYYNDGSSIIKYNFNEGDISAKQNFNIRKLERRVLDYSIGNIFMKTDVTLEQFRNLHRIISENLNEFTKYFLIDYVDKYLPNLNAKYNLNLKLNGYKEDLFMIYSSKTPNINFLRKILLESYGPFVYVVDFNKIRKRISFMSYLLELGIDVMKQILDTFNISFENDSDTISYLYYIFVNNSDVKLNIKNINSQKYTLEEHKNWIKDQFNISLNNYDNAAIFFHGIFLFSPFYSKNRMVKYKESKLCICDYFDIYKFNLYYQTLQNPISVVPCEITNNPVDIIISYLNESNYIELANLYGIVYPSNVLGSHPYTYIKYFIKNLNKNLFIENRDMTQFEEFFYNKISYYGENYIENNPCSIFSNYGQILRLINFDNSKEIVERELELKNINSDKLNNYINKKCKKYSQNNESVINTFKYLYYKLRSGIYCEIKNNKLIKFFLFVNPDYENPWQNVKFRGLKNFSGKTLEQIHNSKQQDDLTLEEYRNFKSYYLSLVNKKNVRKENYIKLNNWWCNSWIINNNPKKFDNSPIIGIEHCKEIIKLLVNICNTRKIKDCKFFINKRDHPVLKNDLSYPYNFITANEKKWKKGLKIELAPILSWTGSDEFSDILIPNIDDINNAYKYTENITNINYPTKWDERENKAIFLGSTTGPPRKEDNQRVILSEIIKNNKKIMTGGITLVNYRDKVNNKDLIEFTTQPINIVSKVPMPEQIVNKYAINVDGHAAAYRFSTLHYLKFLVFKVDSLPNRKNVGTLWANIILEKDKDYVNVDYEMNNLIEKINYYIDNDDEARKIVKRATNKIDKYFSLEGISDYMATLFNNF